MTSLVQEPRRGGLDQRCPSKAAAIFVLGAATSATVTWIVKDSLDQPQLSASVLYAHAAEDVNAEFTLFYLGALEEFLGDIPGYTQELLDVAKSLESDGVNFASTESSSSERTAALLSSLLSARDRLMKKIPMSPELVQAGVTKATNGMNRLRQAQVEISGFLSRNPVPLDGDVSKYSALFLKYDNDDFYTRYVPSRPRQNASAAQRYTALQRSSEGLERAISVIETSVVALSEELEAAQRLSKRKNLDVLVIVKNLGNTPGNLFNAAAIELATKDRDRLYLTTDVDLAELVVPAKGHKTIRLRLVQGARNADDVWSTAMQRYRSASAEAVLKLTTVHGDVVVSGRFPFYARDAFTEQAYRSLAR